jgi:hypothetical protein
MLQDGNNSIYFRNLFLHRFRRVTEQEPPCLNVETCTHTNTQEEIQTEHFYYKVHDQGTECIKVQDVAL